MSEPKSKKGCLSENERERALDLAQALCEAFSWGRTTQGEAYWRGVHENLCAVARAPPTKAERLAEAKKELYLAEDAVARAAGDYDVALRRVRSIEAEP